MELSLTAVTANRGFSKALTRNSGALAGLEHSLSGLDLPDGRIETLQIVFKDRGDGFVQVVGGVERFTQVQVGIPEDPNQYLDGEDKFVEFVRGALLRAIAELHIPTGEREMILARVRAS